MKPVYVLLLTLISLKSFTQDSLLSAAGATSQIQFNQNGVLTGDPSMQFDNEKKELLVPNLSITAGRDAETTTIFNIPTIRRNSGKLSIDAFGDFYHTLSQSYINGDGQRDAVYQWGYNHTGVGGRVNTEEAEFHTALESHYQRHPGADPEFEYHWETTTKDGRIQQRIYTMNISKTSGNAISSWQMDGMQWFPSGMNRTDSGFSTYATLMKSGEFRLSGPQTQLVLSAGTAGIQIQPVNDGTGLTRIANVGSGIYPAIEFQSTMVFTSPTWFAGNANYFTFNATGTPAGGTNLFAIQLNGENKIVAYPSGALMARALAAGNLTGIGNRSLMVNENGELFAGSSDDISRSLPIASAASRGAIRIGEGLSVDSSTGVVSVTAAVGVPAEQVSISGESMLQNNSQAQNTMESPIELEDDTDYVFEGQYIITGTSTPGPQSAALSFALVDGSSITSVSYVASVSTSHVTVNVSIPLETYITGIGPKVLNTLSNGDYVIIKFQGVWKNKSAGGVMPQISFSQNGRGNNLLKDGSYVKFTRVNRKQNTAF